MACGTSNQPLIAFALTSTATWSATAWLLLLLLDCLSFFYAQQILFCCLFNINLILLRYCCCSSFSATAFKWHTVGGQIWAFAPCFRCLATWQFDWLAHWRLIGLTKWFTDHTHRLAYIHLCILCVVYSHDIVVPLDWLPEVVVRLVFWVAWI